tara:strand:- start:4172 stop:4339 length:168 start_codon:yes stop_codon:yes gene_type:complete
MKEKDEFEKAMLDYIAELEVDSVVSRSQHFVKSVLMKRFGREAVQGWLNNHFDNK